MSLLLRSSLADIVLVVQRSMWLLMEIMEWIPYRCYLNLNLKRIRELKSFEATRWHNNEVDSGNNFIEIKFKKVIMVKSFGYLASLYGGFVANYK